MKTARHIEEAAHGLRKERERQPCDISVSELGQAAPRKQAGPEGSADATRSPQVRAPGAVLPASCVTNTDQEINSSLITFEFTFLGQRQSNKTRPPSNSNVYRLKFLTIRMEKLPVLGSRGTESGVSKSLSDKSKHRPSGV